MVIRFLSKVDEWKDFSNLSSHKIEMEGRTWKSVEHYYQYKKFEKSDKEFAEIIRETSTPRNAKMLAMKNNNFPKTWFKENMTILEEAVTKKFESHPKLAEFLLSTKNQELIEANPDDYFWGEGKDGTGKNMMGKLLMKVRTNLKKQSQEKNSAEQNNKSYFKVDKS